MRSPTPPPGQLLIVGALHVDDIATSRASLVPRASNPVTWKRSVGGVAANAALAARRIADQHTRITLSAAIGSDAIAEQLENVVLQAGLCPKLQRMAGRSTGRYTAVLDADGELHIGLSDVALAEELEAGFVDVKDRESAIKALLLDANLSAECLQSLVEHARLLNIRIAAMSVAPSKAKRLLPLARELDLLFINRREAIALVNPRLPLSIPLQNLADGLRNIGFRNLVLTDGGNPILVLEQEIQCLIPVPPIAHCRSVNGAGDALAGASFAAWSAGNSLAAAVRDHGLVQSQALVGGRQSPIALN